MQNSITVNEKTFEWRKDLTLIEVLRLMGYTMKVPAVLIRVNGELIKKTLWNDYRIPEDAEIQVLNILRGG